MTPTTITLQSAHGRFLNADPTGAVHADAEKAGEWERWRVEPLGGEFVALCNDAHGRYLTAARDDTARTPRCEATTIGEWERWRVVLSEGVAFQGEHGGYLTAELDGVVSCHAEALTWQGWLSDPVDWWLEAPEPPNAIKPAAGLVGRLRIDHGVFVDDTGPVLPLFAHGGDLFSQYTRDPAFALGQLDDLAAAGYHGARIWFTLGCGRDALCDPNHFWAGRECGPNHTPAYWDQVGQFLIELHTRGLRAVWSQGDPAQTGGDMEARKGYAAQVANVARQVDGTGYVIAFFDAGNEAWQNDAGDRLFHDSNPDDCANMAAFVKAYTAAGGTGLTTTTSPTV